MSKDLLITKKDELRNLLCDELVKFNDPRVYNLCKEIESLENEEVGPKYSYSFILFISSLLVIGIICITKILL